MYVRNDLNLKNELGRQFNSQTAHQARRLKHRNECIVYIILKQLINLCVCMRSEILVSKEIQTGSSAEDGYASRWKFRPRVTSN